MFHNPSLAWVTLTINILRGFRVTQRRSFEKSAVDIASGSWSEHNQFMDHIRVYTSNLEYNIHGRNAWFSGDVEISNGDILLAAIVLR